MAASSSPPTSRLHYAWIAAGVTFLVGSGVARYGSIGVPVAFTSVAFLIGLLLLPWGLETKGKGLPQ